MSRIQITQADINEIKSAAGYPLVTQLDFRDQTDHFIIDNVIPRVLRIYFSYFPIRIDNNVGVSGNFEIAYPETDVIRMLRHYFNYKQLNYSHFSPFLLQAMTINKGTSFQGFEHDHIREAIHRLSTEEALIDYTRGFRIDDYPHERKVKGFTNIAGDVTIEWAKKSDNFDNIIYNQKDNAIKLSKAYFLQEIHRIRNQIQLNTKVTLSTDVLKTDADRWEEEVIASWTRRGFAVLVKS